MGSTLMVHRGAQVVSGRGALAEIDEPISLGSRHRPVPHFELVRTLDDALSDRGIHIRREQFATQHDGAALFGIMDVEIDPSILTSSAETRGFAIGLRSANDRSMAIRLAAGSRVFVCDNMVLSGSMIALKRKHTTGLDLRAELDEAVGRYLQHAKVLDTRIEMARSYKVGDETAKALILDAATNGTMPLRLVPVVARTYFDPPEGALDITENRGTLWGLHNAFTRAVKLLKPGPAFTTTVKLGRLLSLN